MCVWPLIWQIGLVCEPVTDALRRCQSLAIYGNAGKDNDRQSTGPGCYRFRVPAGHRANGRCQVREQAKVLSCPLRRADTAQKSADDTSVMLAEILLARAADLTVDVAIAGLGIIHLFQEWLGPSGPPPVRSDCSGVCARLLRRGGLRRQHHPHRILPS